jgi:hypothetical protein
LVALVINLVVTGIQVERMRPVYVATILNVSVDPREVFHRELSYLSIGSAASAA